MRISPRYGAPPVLRVEAGGREVARLLVQQARRFGEALDRLAEEQWSGPTRCDGWRVQDVVSHLVTTNQYWALSLSSGFAGEPTRYLDGFDPVATPADLVAAEGGRSAAEVLDRYRGACEQLAEVVLGAGDEDWERPAEAPPGHLAANAVAMHALWDSWVHERDVLLPLGAGPPEDPAEVRACLQYAVALGPGFRAASGAPGSGVVGVVGHAPEASLVVALGDTVHVAEGTPPDDAPILEGESVALVEALSRRAAFPPGASPEAVDRLGGLDVVFDQA